MAALERRWRDTWNDPIQLLLRIRQLLDRKAGRGYAGVGWVGVPIALAVHFALCMDRVLEVGGRLAGAG